MAENTLRQVLRANVLNLLVEERALKINESGVQRLVKLGIPNGTAQRVLSADVSIGLDVIEQVAAVLGVAPWRLLRPQVEIPAVTRDEAGLGDTRLAAQIQRLPQEPRHAVQVIVSALTTVGARKKSAPPTSGDTL